MFHVEHTEWLGYVPSRTAVSPSLPRGLAKRPAQLAHGVAKERRQHADGLHGVRPFGAGAPQVAPAAAARLRGLS